MGLGIKRKRGKEAGPRKTPKFVGGIDADDLNKESNTDQADAKEGELVVGDGNEEWGCMARAEETTGDEHRPNTATKKTLTGEELRTIKDATDLFRSSTFKLQIDALLPNVRPKASITPLLDRFLLTLHAFLMAIPSVSPQHPLEAARRLLTKNIAVPYALPSPTENSNWKVGFEKPSDITLVGSWANKVNVKAKDGIRFGVDLALEMPDDLFQEKDYLNGRFFHKRAFYLATIAAAVKASKDGLNVDIFYDSFSDDPRLTKLILVPRQDGLRNDLSKINAQVCIIPVLSPHSPIALHRLSPSHSNIRISTFVDDVNKSSSFPTPIYNTALLLALTPKYHLLAAHTIKEGSPAFVDALTLLRVWANQRGYDAGSGMCVRGFEGRGSWWSALLGMLISGEERIGTVKMRRKPLGRGLSSYQLFRAALDFLSKHDFQKDPVFMKTQDGQHRFSPDEYREHHETVFVDSSSTVNLLAGVPLGSLELLRHDARKTLENLDETSMSNDTFTTVFLKDHRDLPTRFDTVLRIDLSSAKSLNPLQQSTMDTGSPANALMASLASLLSYGLGDRTKAVGILHPSSSPRSISQAHPSHLDTIYVGLIHNPQNAFRLVDHGPAADEEDQSVTQRFRDFWGEKAELRRFKDGRIVESVVWDVKTADERAHIPGMIVRHILNRHFMIKDDAMQTWQKPFDAMLRLPESISSLYRSSEIVTGFKGAISAFDSLVKRIKAEDDGLPLTLLNVSPVSEYLRYTSVFSPVPLPLTWISSMPVNARYLAPIDIVFEFEKSSKWPDDLKAIQKIKLALFERVATVLMASIPGLQATVTVGDGVSASEILDKFSLELVTPEGWAFSARIWHQREATLLDRIIDNKVNKLPHVTPALSRTNRGKEYHEAVEAKEMYMRRFVHAPRHHRAIASLCHQHSAYAGTVRLVKRWLASHWLLHGHISEEVIEIICASLFVGDGRDVGADGDAKTDGRANIPGSKERGLAMIVEFFKDWKWEDGLYVPLYGKDFATSPEASRTIFVKTLDTSVWRVSTAFDREGRMWTSHGPDFAVAHRVRALAKATWECLKEMQQGRLDVQTMFIHPTEDYDFVIELDAAVLPRYYQNPIIDSTMLSRRGAYANVLQDDANGTLRPGFDPARSLFYDLQRIYADTFKIFYDPFGGDRLGGVWDPTLKQPRPFRVLGQFSSIAVKTDNRKPKDRGLVTLNEGSVLSEIERLGKALIKEIVVHV